MEPLDIGPGKHWALMLWTLRLIFGGIALFFIAYALFADAGGVDDLVVGLVFVPFAVVLPAVLARKEPHATLTADGLDGPNLPERVAWADIRGAEVRIIPPRGRRPEMRYVTLDVPDAEAYVARASAVRRVMLKANALYKLPPLTLEVGSLSKTPDEIAALVRERAAYAGPAA
jgi:hypothetical protein